MDQSPLMFSVRGYTDLMKTFGTGTYFCQSSFLLDPAHDDGPQHSQFFITLLLLNFPQSLPHLLRNHILLAKNPNKARPTCHTHKSV